MLAEQTSLKHKSSIHQKHAIVKKCKNHNLVDTILNKRIKYLFYRTATAVHSWMLFRQLRCVHTDIILNIFERLKQLFCSFCFFKVTRKVFRWHQFIVKLSYLVFLHIVMLREQEWATRTRVGTCQPGILHVHLCLLQISFAKMELFHHCNFVSWYTLTNM